MKKTMSLILTIIFLLSLSINSFAENKESSGFKLTFTKNYAGEYYSIAYGKGTFVAVGMRGAVVTSKDGLTWTKRNSGVDQDLRDVMWTGKQFMAVGSMGVILNSKDGIKWTKNQVDTRYTLNNTEYANGRYVCVGSNIDTYKGVIFTSGDGVNWNRNSYDEIGDLTGVASDGKTFVAVGVNYNTNEQIILSSEDCEVWTPRHDKGILGETLMYRIIYEQGKFVAFGGYTTCDIAVSEDGVNWKSVKLNGYAAYSGLWNGKLFVLQGAVGYFYTSADGVTWDIHQNEAKHTVIGAAFANDTYVSVDSNGEILLDATRKKGQQVSTSVPQNSRVLIEMQDGGKMVFELYPEYAPQTVRNFEKLVKSGFYNGLTFHRIIKGFMIQGGDPKGDGTGGSDTPIIGEFAQNGFTKNTLKHTKGVISMARTSAYDTATSQFFIMDGEASWLDGQYAAFGILIEGEEVLDKLAGTPVSNNMNTGETSQPESSVIMKKVSILYSDYIVEKPDYKIVVEGKSKKLNSVPVRVNGKFMVPVDEMLSNMGIGKSNIVWDAKKESCKIINGKNTITFKIGEKVAYINGKAVNLDAKTLLYKNMAYISINSMTLFDKTVKFDKAANSYLINKK